MQLANDAPGRVVGGARFDLELVRNLQRRSIGNTGLVLDLAAFAEGAVVFVVDKDIAGADLKAQSSGGRRSQAPGLFGVLNPPHAAIEIQDDDVRGRSDQIGGIST